MEMLLRLTPYRARGVLIILFVLGIVVLVGTWIALFWGESLFTESHLVGYYCCVTEQELPAPGSLERTMSDFFRTLPGKHLPSLIFVGVNVCLFVLCMRRGDGNTWWLPFLFIAFNTLYLLVDFELVVVSWSISNRLVGPQTGAYKGYGRTGYGIVLHLMLWGAYLLTLLAACSWLNPGVRPARGSSGPRDSLLE
jgi:hypothetical protein